MSLGAVRSLEIQHPKNDVAETRIRDDERLTWSLLLSSLLKQISNASRYLRRSIEKCNANKRFVMKPGKNSRL
jgi:hypothetical protein